MSNEVAHGPRYKIHTPQVKIRDMRGQDRHRNKPAWLRGVGYILVKEMSVVKELLME